MMAVTVVKQFLGTIRSGSTFTWNMGNANPPFPPVPFEDRQPIWIVDWQAVVIFFSPDNPQGASATPGIRIDPVTIVTELDTSQTHVVTLSCIDHSNIGVGFTATYVLYAIFIDI
jgi:hypothetical protein